MNTSGVFALPCILLAAGITVHGQVEPYDRVPSITFLVHDFAGLDNSVYADTKRKLAEVFRAVRVEVSWVDCVPDRAVRNQARCRAPQRQDVYLRLVERAQLQGGQVHLQPLGYIEPYYAGRGLITVLTAPVREMICGSIWQFPDLLARAITHEVGHLVGKLDHGPAGIMAPNWTKRLLCQAPLEVLSFSHAELRAIEIGVQQRTRDPRENRPPMPPEQCTHVWDCSGSCVPKEQMEARASKEKGLHCQP